MLLHNYLDTNTYTVNLVKKNLSEIPCSEIQNIKKRVDFYVNHYKISTRNTISESKTQQMDFLINLNFALETEIRERSLAVA